MRFMIIATATTETEAVLGPTREACVAMRKYNEDLIKAGILLAAERLAPSSQGTRVKISGDVRIVIDGPFTDVKQLIAGFSIIQVKSKEEAIEWVKRAPNGFPDREGEIEIRQVMDADDPVEVMGVD